MNTRSIQIAISSVAALVAVGHTWLPEITIDAITVTLLGIAVLPWLGPLFKSVEIPGGVKVEFQELEEASKKVERSGLIPAELVLKPMQKHVYAFQAVSENDPNLALSGLRIEIESRLKKLAERREIEVRGYGANNLTKSLEKAGVLSHDEAAAIRDLLPLLNQAAHGAEVEDSAFGWAMDFGPRVIGALEDRLGETTTPKLIEDWKRRDGAAAQEIGTELSKSFVQSPEAFLASMNENPKEFKDWLEGLGNHTFTIFEARNEVEDELYLAYYEKLKALMLDAARSCRETKYGDLAKAVENEVNKVKVRRIW